MVVAQGLEGGKNEELWFNGYGVSVMQEEKIVEICCTKMWI